MPESRGDSRRGDHSRGDSRGRPATPPLQENQGYSGRRRSSKDKNKWQKYQVDDQVQHEREKIQKINELMEEKKRKRTQKESITDEKSSEQAPIELSYQEVLNKSYTALQQKKFEKRYEYLYERALVQKNAR